MFLKLTTALLLIYSFENDRFEGCKTFESNRKREFILISARLK